MPSLPKKNPVLRASAPCAGVNEPINSDGAAARRTPQSEVVRGVASRRGDSHASKRPRFRFNHLRQFLGTVCASPPEASTFDNCAKRAAFISGVSESFQEANVWFPAAAARTITWAGDNCTEVSEGHKEDKTNPGGSSMWSLCPPPSLLVPVIGCDFLWQAVLK